MKEKDFLELIDLKAEYKEYVRFDKGKSEKFKTYADWETHTKSILSACKSPTDMYNLKRYCLDVIRSNNDLGQFVWGYLGLCFPLLLAFTTESDRVGFNGFALMFFLCAFLFYVTCISKSNARKKHFYEDVLMMIEHIGD